MRANLHITKSIYRSYLDANKTYKGIFWKVLTCFFIACDNALIRYLSSNTSVSSTDPLPIYTIMIFQNASALIFIIPWILKKPKKILFTKHKVLHISRISITIGGIAIWYTSLKFIPLIQAVSITFIGPFLTILGAIIFLKETISLKKGITLILAMTGLFLISRPDKILSNDSELGLLIFLPILAALFMSTAKIITRKLMILKEKPIILVLYLIISIIIVMLFPALICGWVNPTAKQLAFLPFLGLLTIFINYSYVKAYSFTEITILLPFGIPSKIVLNGLIAYIIFGEAPKTMTMWIGIVLLIISSIILKYISSDLKKQIN